MRGDQLIRVVGIAAATAAFVARLVVVGNGSMDVLGYQATPFALYLAATILLALPETIDRLPFGPTRAKK